MITAMIGRKVGMTQVFDETGAVHPATVIECGPNVVTQIKTKDKDGYEAVQLGFEIDSRLNKPEQGHRKESGFLSRNLREVKASSIDSLEVGQVFKADLFQAGQLVDVTGTSKGRGFQGGVKRHGFAGGPKTHGQSDRLRAPGSIGASATPGRVWKGMKMAGRMGNDQVTQLNLEVLQVDPDRNLLVIKGSLPGHNRALVVIRHAVKRSSSKK